jgi:hypothetical protein
MKSSANFGFAPSNPESENFDTPELVMQFAKCSSTRLAPATTFCFTDRWVGPEAPKLFDRRFSPRVDERRAAMLIFLNRAPVAQLDQSVWLRTRRSGVRVSPGAPFLLF